MGFKSHFEAAAAGRKKDEKGKEGQDAEHEPHRTLREMRGDKAGGSEGIVKEPIDRELLRKIFEQKLHEKPEVRDALEALMNAIDKDVGVHEAFERLQDAAAKYISVDAGT